MSGHGIHLAAMATRGAIAARRNAAQQAGVVTVSAVLIEVSAEFGTPIRDLLGPWRRRGLVVARHAAMALARRHTMSSLPAIGRVMQRDHTSIHDGIAKHAAREAADPALAARVAAISERLERRSIHA